MRRMPKTVNPTLLHHVLRALTTAQQEKLAARAGVTVSRLYQIAGCQSEPKLRFALRLIKATQWAHKHYGSPSMTIDGLASMCPIAARITGK